MAKAKAAGSGAEKPKSNPAIETPLKKTTAKAVWSGYLTAFGLMSIPIKAYKATDEDKIERNMYHSADCVNQLKYQSMVCTGCGEELSREQAVKGVTVNDKIVLISDDELKACAPRSENELSVFEFVPSESIDVTYYATHEYIGAGDGGVKAFATFRDGLALSNRVAIGRVVSRNHEYYVAIRPSGSFGLIMSYLFAEYEVRTCDKWDTSIKASMADAQVLAGLMNEHPDYAKEKFSPAPYDSFLKNARVMIAKRAAGEKVETPKQAEPVHAQGDMMSAMKEMLNRAKAKKQGKAA